jgi:hypothetical protein
MRELFESPNAWAGMLTIMRDHAQQADSDS